MTPVSRLSDICSLWTSGRRDPRAVCPFISGDILYIHFILQAASALAAFAPPNHLPE